MINKYLAQFALQNNNDKPVIGVSACLLGRPVRYDGDSKPEPLITNMLSQYVRLREFCPEVGIGLPVPRTPIQVVNDQGTRRVRSVTNPQQEFSQALTHYADTIPIHLHGFVLKARSPSCGVNSTPLVDQHNDQIGYTSGQFALRLQERFPCAPIVDESTLTDQHAIAQLLLCIYLYRAWQHRRDLSQVNDWLGQLPTLNPLPCKPVQHYLEQLTAHSQ